MVLDEKRESSVQITGKATNADAIPYTSLPNATLEASYQAVPMLRERRTLEEMIEIAHEERSQEAATEGLY